MPAEGIGTPIVRADAGIPTAIFVEVGVLEPALCLHMCNCSDPLKISNLPPLLPG